MAGAYPFMNPRIQRYIPNRRRASFAAVLGSLGLISSKVIPWVYDRLKSGVVNTATYHVVNEILRRRDPYAVRVIRPSQSHRLRAFLRRNNLLSNYYTMAYRKRTYRPRGKSSRRRPARSRKYSQQKNGQTISKRAYSKRTSRPKSLKSQVKHLSKMIKSDQAYHLYKSYSASNVTATTGATHIWYPVVSATNLEASMANLRYYDPSVPGTLTTANASTGTYSRQVHFKNVYGSLEIANNYQIPCKVKVYLVKPKSDTNISPITYYTNGITDQVISGGNADTPGLYLTDIDVFRNQYSARVIKDITLDAGSACSVSYSVSGIDYDPSMYDSHTLDFQPKFKSFGFVIRTEGCLGHDNSADEQGLLRAEVDVIQLNKFSIVYDAGVNLNDIYVSDTRVVSFTNTPVICNKPVADNQAYSTA